MECSDHSPGRKKLAECDLQRKQIRPQEAEFFGKDAKEKLAKEEIILEAKDIWFRYDKDQPDVVKGLNLSLKRGEFFALLGGKEPENQRRFRSSAGFESHTAAKCCWKEKISAVTVKRSCFVAFWGFCRRIRSLCL